MTNSLQNYHRLRDKVDNLCRGITKLLGDSLACKTGCSSCCLQISVFPVEAASIIEILKKRPPEELLLLKRNLSKWDKEDRCTFLSDDLCLIYENRPIICRTHGLPILLAEQNIRRIDICPKNCNNISQLPGEAVIDLERLNIMLTAVNALYMAELSSKLPDRIKLSDLVTMLP